MSAGTAFAATNTGAAAKTAINKSPEASLKQGLECIRKSDLPCAQLATASIPSQSPYASVLAGRIAAAQGDFDRTLRLLLPLQVNTELAPAAIASLHTSLALAYEAQPDEPRALEQRLLAEAGMSDAADIEANHEAIWKLLSNLSRDQLIDMRGTSQNAAAQGWIDLALAVQRPASPDQSIAEWQRIYPDHPAAAEFAKKLAAQLSSGSTSTSAAALNAPIALILPLGVQAFYPVSDAIERGFVAAQAIDGNQSELKIYATQGDGNEIAGIYQQALSEGAKFVVGPVTNAEVTSLASGSTDVTTLALNQPDGGQHPDHLFTFGLSLNDEARQIASVAQRQGMQTAIIIAASGGLSDLMAKAFREAWEAAGGQVVQQIDVVEGTALDGLKSTIATYPADFIVLATNGAEARAIRPNLDIATPTFGFSHIYEGLAYDPANAPLSAVHFVDIPWVLKPDSPAFAGYLQAAAELPRGEMQRWFALGADAYRVLQVLTRQPLQATVIDGLTGKIRISESGEISRELALARFSADGITVEHLP